MKQVGFCVLALAASCSTTTNNYPVGPVGGADGGVRSDAAVIDSRVGQDATNGDGPSSLDAAMIDGRVCLVADPRDLLGCASTGAGGLTVWLGANNTTTNDDGTFTIMGSPSSNAVWVVTGANIVTSSMVLSDYQIPAISRTTFQSMLTTNGVALVPGQGSIIASVIKNGAGYAAATAFSTPSSTYEPFYDGASATSWTQTATGTNGAVWLPGIDVGTATATVQPMVGQPITTKPQPIVDGGITYVTVVFP